MFNELKEAMEHTKQTTNKNHEHVRVEIRKLQAEIIELKNLEDKMKNLWKGLTSIATITENRINELEGEMLNTSLQQKPL